MNRRAMDPVFPFAFIGKVLQSAWSRYILFLPNTATPAISHGNTEDKE